MARNYKPRPHKGLALLCVIMAFLLAAACTLGGLELWGTDKMKPSNWGKQDELAPVTISFTDDAPAPFGIVQTLENGARAYPLMTTASASYPSSKTAIAECTLPEGGTPDLYKWSITGGERLSVRPIPDSNAAIITAQNYFTGAATLTVRAYCGAKIRGKGSINIYAYEPEPEPEPEPMPAVSLVLFDIHGLSTQYQYDIEEFKKEVLPSIAEDIDFKEISTDINDTTIQINFENLTISEADIAVIFDSHGIIANAITSFDLLAENGIAFIVIDDMPYAAEKVEAAGGYYLTTNNYNANNARAILDEWNIYGQEVAFKYHTPDASETAFNAFIDELFDYSAQEFSEDELGDLYSQYAYEYDVVICVPDIDTFSRYYYALDNPSVVTWIVGDYYCGEGYDPSEQLYTDYPETGNAIVYQRQLNERDIINAIIGLMNNEDISEYFAFNHVRILP